MTRNGNVFTWESLVRLLLGTAASVVIGYARIGPRGLYPNFVDSPYLSLGIIGSLVYILYLERGRVTALGAAMLLSLISAAYAQRGYTTVWPLTFALMFVLVTLCHYLVVWKIDKPAIGRLFLLGPLFGMTAGLLMLFFRLFASTEGMFVAAWNQALWSFQLGVGLAIGLESAELLIRYLHAKQATAEKPVEV
jgi:hypothetical protein